ncbi:hypothetical protein HBI18_203820 [Parastagonospora nodorum]|nr:hypothetical protein HBI78_217760 [Parastagonospora nodorum]KAH5168687.1 hypothetical protein HBH77_235790 [Parastagonospora nodorum]KAH5713356.1 hypothetical protein HBI18_203820 [Parastagonospora nodorum]
MHITKTENMGSQHEAEISSLSSAPAKHARPEVPPPPYFETYLISPSSFKAAINQKLSNPFTSLFQVTFRFLQFAFALAAGISYAIELSHGNVSRPTTFIYSQVVFGITLLFLIVDSTTVRTYRLTWMVEWTLVILWFVCFAVFYQAYLSDAVKQEYEGADVGRMKRAAWCDLINALLWFRSAIFSSTMCCTGIKAAAQNRLEKRRAKKNRNQSTTQKMEEMESGLIGTTAR